MKHMKKRKARKFRLAKYQIVPCTCRLLLIMYSNVKATMVKFADYTATAKPVARSTATSGT